MGFLLGSGLLDPKLPEQATGEVPARATHKPPLARLEGTFGPLPVYLVGGTNGYGYNGLEKIVGLQGKQELTLMDFNNGQDSDKLLRDRLFKGLCSLFKDLDQTAVTALIGWADRNYRLAVVNTQKPKLQELTDEDYALLCLSYSGRNNYYYTVKWTDKQLKQVQELRKACPQLVTKDQLAALLAFGRNNAGLEAVPYSYFLGKDVVKALTPKQLEPLKRLATVVASTTSLGRPLAPEVKFSEVIPVLPTQVTWNPFAVFTYGDGLHKKHGVQVCTLPLHNGVFLKYLETLTVGEVVKLFKEGTVDHKLSGAVAVDQAKRILSGKKKMEVELQSAEEMPKALAAVMRTFKESKLTSREGKEITNALWDHYHKPFILRAVAMYYSDHKVGSLEDFMGVLSRLGNRGQQKWVSGNSKNADLVLERLLEVFTLEKSLELIVKVSNDRQTLSLIDWTNLANNWEEAYDDMPASFWISMVKGDKKILEPTEGAAPEEA